MNGMSKWVETAIRPVPERSHILKTWPTNAGPSAFPSEFRPEILSVDGNPELNSADEDKPLTAADFEESRSRWVDSKPKWVSKGGFREAGNATGIHSLEEECWRENGGIDWGLAKRVQKLEVAEWKKWVMNLIGWCSWGSLGGSIWKAMKAWEIASDSTCNFGS